MPRPCRLTAGYRPSPPGTNAFGVEPPRVPRRHLERLVAGRTRSMCPDRWRKCPGHALEMFLSPLIGSMTPIPAPKPKLGGLAPVEYGSRRCICDGMNAKDSPQSGQESGIFSDLINGNRDWSQL